MISIKKRGKNYQYCFEAGKINGKRKQITKCGFKTKKEALIAGQIVYNEYINGGLKEESKMYYADYLDYWLKECFEITHKPTTAKRYKETFMAIKQEIGNIRIYNLTPYILNQTLLKLSQKSKTKEGLRNYQKVIKSSLRDATYYFGFIKYYPAADLQIPRVLRYTISIY